MQGVLASHRGRLLQAGPQPYWTKVQCVDRTGFATLVFPECVPARREFVGGECAHVSRYSLAGVYGHAVKRSSRAPTRIPAHAPELD